MICGACIPVRLIIRELGEGATEADLLEAYRGLTRADVHPALTYGKQDPS
jgi:uncharacterized protein (DUF433 family)